MAFWLLLYNIGVRALLAIYTLASFFNPKAKKWVSGRKNWLNNLKVKITAAQKDNQAPLIWVHASSLGEFEQAKPIIEALKQDKKPPFIVVSFFSPSGFEASHKYAYADHLFYLPADTATNAYKLISVLQPNLVIWIKYEYWYNYLSLLQKKNIPVLLVSAFFRKDKVFFKWYGALHRKMLTFFQQVFVQDEASASSLGCILPSNKITLSGDTRFDRVISIHRAFSRLETIEKWLGNRRGKVLVAGSTWDKDIEVLRQLAQAIPELVWIIAPHHVDKSTIANVASKFKNATLYSQMDEINDISDGNVLIIDNIGMLSRLYNYGNFCFVGGGFAATGIHNILEAAVYGKPVLFGYNHSEYAEGQELINSGGAFSLSNAEALIKQVKYLIGNQKIADETGKLAKEYIEKKGGATEKIADYIYKNRLLTS